MPCRACRHGSPSCPCRPKVAPPHRHRCTARGSWWSCAARGGQALQPHRGRATAPSLLRCLSRLVQSRCSWRPSAAAALRSPRRSPALPCRGRRDGLEREEDAPWGVEVEDLGTGCTGGVRHGELRTWGGGCREDERKRRVGRRPWCLYTPIQCWKSLKSSNG
jgi:hypothetical protein